MDGNMWGKLIHGISRDLCAPAIRGPNGIESWWINEVTKKKEKEKKE